MENRNAVKKHIESFFQALDETKRKSSSPITTFLWNRMGSFKSTEVNPTEKLKQISGYIEALEENIIQQDNTITNRNKEIENIKNQLERTLKEKINLKASFNKKRTAQITLLKEKDENLVRLTAHMHNLQEQLDAIKKLYNKHSKEGETSTEILSKLDSTLEELKITQLKDFSIIFREFEKELSNSWIEKIESVGNKLRKDCEETQQTHSSCKHDKAKGLNESFKKQNILINGDNKIVGDKEEAD